MTTGFEELVRAIVRDELAKVTASPAPVKDVLTADEVAALLHIPVSTVRERTRQGKLRKVPGLGRTVRYARASIEGLLK